MVAGGTVITPVPAREQSVGIKNPISNTSSIVVVVVVVGGNKGVLAVVVVVVVNETGNSFPATTLKPSTVVQHPFIPE